MAVNIKILLSTKRTFLNGTNNEDLPLTKNPGNFSLVLISLMLSKLGKYVHASILMGETRC